MCNQLVGSESLSRLQHYAGGHKFTPHGIGDSKDRRFLYRRKLVDDCFDLAAVNLFTPGDDQVLDAVQDVEISVYVLIAHVARAKHSISKHRIGVLWIIPIPPHDIGAPKKR